MNPRVLGNAFMFLDMRLFSFDSVALVSYTSTLFPVHVSGTLKLFELSRWYDL